MEKTPTYHRKKLLTAKIPKKGCESTNNEKH
jgi:hypothetical protein